MIALPVSMSHEDYLMRHIGENLDLSDVGVLHIAWHIAAHQHHGQHRRSGGKYIEHPMVVAMMIKELGLSVAAQAAALLHDTIEDGENSKERIRRAFHKKYGNEIAFMVQVMTKDGLTTSQYLRRIAKCSRISWETPVVKIIDRLHNLICPHGGNPEREVRMLKETVGEFQRMCKDCRPHIPDHFALTYDQLVQQVVETAQIRLAMLESN